MNLPPAAAFFATSDATWPAAEFLRHGPFMLRRGEGGGQRVSAATAEGAWTATDIPGAEAAMQAMGQTPLFMVRAGEDTLDAALADQGYRIVDPVLVLAGDTGGVAGAGAAHMTAFSVWPPLAIMHDLWAGGGIAAARIKVMHRAADPKTAILGRINDRAAGVAFVSVHDNIAMLHALVVAPAMRKQGAGGHILRAAAAWAQNAGATCFATVTTGENLPARALFTSLGMQIVGHYHYRMKRAP